MKKILSVLNLIILIIGGLSLLAGTIIALISLPGLILDGLHWMGWTYRTSSELSVNFDPSCVGVLFVFGMVLLLIHFKLEERLERLE